MRVEGALASTRVEGALASARAAGGPSSPVRRWPMEYLKTQLQTFRKVKGGPPPPFTGIGSGLAYTVRTTGALSLYTGLAPVLASLGGAKDLRRGAPSSRGASRRA